MIFGCTSFSKLRFIFVFIFRYLWHFTLITQKSVCLYLFLLAHMFLCKVLGVKWTVIIDFLVLPMVNLLKFIKYCISMQKKSLNCANFYFLDNLFLRTFGFFKSGWNLRRYFVNVYPKPLRRAKPITKSWSMQKRLNLTLSPDLCIRS